MISVEFKPIKTWITKEIKYVVLQTGYTGRLANRDSISHILARSDNDGGWEPAFINDSSYGKGFYDISSLTYDDVSVNTDNHDLKPSTVMSKYVTNVINILEDNNINIDGSICFKCDSFIDAMNAAENLSEIYYCYGFDVANLICTNYIEKEGILILNYDCESG
jgi:hypothetical protein